jgi:hypothetical protein
LRSYNKYWFLILGLVILMFSSLIACGMPGFTKYTNKEFGYTISYPINWQVEISKDATRCVLTSPSRKASVMIDVVEGMTAREAANYWLISLGTAWHEVTRFEDRPMQGFWDWYLSYEWDAYLGTYHGEAYFKQTKTHVYRLDTAGDVAGYKEYPFPAMISSFKLR